MDVYATDSDADMSLSDLTVGVWGLGKMGLPLAAVLADGGATVYGVDIDPQIVEQINGGTSPIQGEPEVPELVASYGGTQLRATTDGAAAASKVDVAIVLVPTVLDENHDPILEPVVESATDIAAGLEPGNLVILESTVPPGTTAGTFRETLETSGLRAGEEFGLAFCPERTSSGRVVEDLTESYPKIVGGIDQPTTAAAQALYEQINQPGVIPMDSTGAAEAVKLFEGAYRDVNIALANELAKACEQWGLAAQEIFAAANTQPYCNIHDPGVGVGGHCIPVYPHFIMNRFEEAPLLETARNVNLSMPEHTVGRLSEKLAGYNTELSGADVLVLGLTYRPGVNELRYAPALDVIELLDAAGASVYAHDPMLDSETVADLGATPLSEPTDRSGLDGIVLATGHEQYRELDTDALREATDTPVFVDGRAFFDAEQLSRFDYTAIGSSDGS